MSSTAIPAMLSTLTERDPAGILEVLASPPSRVPWPWGPTYKLVSIPKGFVFHRFSSWSLVDLDSTRAVATLTRRSGTILVLLTTSTRSSDTLSSKSRGMSRFPKLAHALNKIKRYSWQTLVNLFSFSSGRRRLLHYPIIR